MIVPDATLDTCVLYPSYLRDVLLDAAVAGLYRPHWSEETLEELQRNLAERIPPERAARLIAALRATFDDALVKRAAYESYAARAMNHPKDRHVLAAAIASRSTVIVTENLRDFGPAALAPHGIRAMSADDFLTGLSQSAPAELAHVIRTLTHRYRNPPLTRSQLLDRLQSHAPAFVDRMRSLR